ncbi:hypothetical protein J8273_7465 [Carpediemonas membranifera]|uniref:Uncharacterized protein n=1 Tax=Carpediemonas membranifera TaxID=201153 RepID=A0A8J6BV95_9EUKA|nr:hypothetical protein J8273_7465 [Carpediemonas membranifera]|eukprot:KAG9391191.1 hypothetical protein J8273_7465 [Carpediemonas membranifera]
MQTTLKIFDPLRRYGPVSAEKRKSKPPKPQSQEAKTIHRANVLLKGHFSEKEAAKILGMERKDLKKLLNQPRHTVHHHHGHHRNSVSNSDQPVDKRSPSIRRASIATPVPSPCHKSPSSHRGSRERSKSMHTSKPVFSSDSSTGELAADISHVHHVSPRRSSGRERHRSK